MYPKYTNQRRKSPSPMMRTLVKGQTMTTTPQKKTHPAKPMVLPQVPKPTQHHKPARSKPQELPPRAHESTISFQQTTTTTTPSSDHTLDNQLHITPFPPLFQQNTYVSRRIAGKQHRDPSQHPHGSRPRRTKRRWSWIMGDIVYIYISVRPEA
ncbi:hypothetical protein CBS147332_7318 [Penicillium roqueforti]|nr:hypothetical protein CBS147332_7318 [Penicillium roqueforti]KAI3105362.1 hypothetical protein CBS147331_7053 [Penicillium roqueforti]